MGWRTILILWTALSPRAKGELLPIKTYTTADGLAADSVNGIVADSRGFLWFCTSEGLSRFDGYRFVSYGVEDGLPHPAVFTMAETRSGEHWIGTARGLSRVMASGKEARFATYKLGPGTAENYVFSVLESRSGKMLSATRAGVFEWTDPLHFHRREFAVPAPATITDITEDIEGNLWVGATTGIIVVAQSGAVQTFNVKNGLPGNWVEMLLKDSKGRLWAALRGGVARFCRSVPGKWNLEKVYTTESGLVGNDVKALLEARDGTLWIGTSLGISRLRAGAGETPTFESLTRAQGLSDRQITSLAEDRSGNIWAGTEGAGVMRIDRLGFTTYREQDGLRSDRVWSVVEGRAGEVLAVTIPAGPKVTRSVDMFDGVKFRSLSPATFSDHPSWGQDQVLLQNRAGEWWAATGQGLCRFGAMKPVDLDRRKPQVCYAQETTIFRIFEDSKGGIWASAQSPQGDRLFCWNSETGVFFEFPFPRIPAEGEKSRHDLVSAFAEDGAGNIWMGLFKGGVYRYNGREFRHFQREDGIPEGGIRALLMTNSGLWIGSNGGGLGRVQSPGDEHPKVAIYNTTRGMGSNIIQCLVEDRAGHIYAGTGRGVDRLDPENGHIRHYSNADGLAHGTFQGAVRDRNGSLWFATTQGLSRLIPVADPPAVKPRILITDLRIGGAPYALSQLGEMRVGPLELKPSQNQLQAEFVGIDYEPGDIVRYSYMLEGAAAKWSAPRNQASVNFAALQPGKYRFLVKAVTSAGVESAEPAEIDFLVAPPVWKTWWFLSLAVAAAMALVFAAHRYRVAQMVGLERMRTAIATDLHDDIGASLSQIAILSEVARVGGNGRGAGEALERVATLARELVESMGDIVWSIRPEPHAMDSLIRRMREFALDVLASQGIDFELNAPPSGDSLHVSLEVRRQLFLMFKESVHNAVRHSRCTSVVAELKAVDHEVLLIVEDNGIGLTQGEKLRGGAGGTGIQGMQRRAESLGGHMHLASIPGNGCRVEIHLPVRRSRLARTIS
jgi:ligand-binding sensor domain-containing protein/signal transduction histidine kinase